MYANLCRIVVFAQVLAATPLLADPPPMPRALTVAPSQPPSRPMTPSDFAAYAVGRTLSYASGGEVWGQEQYLANHRVMWAFTGQDCQFGSWYPQGDAVCFVYEGDETPKCWNFFMGPGGLIAELIGDNSFTPLSEVGQSSHPLECQGPQVGA